MRAFGLRFLRNRPGAWGLVILSAIVVIAASAPICFPRNPFSIVDKPFLPPFGDRLLGTDMLGRDIASGIAHGARTSLMIGLLATAVAVLVGTVVGSFAGYHGGLADDALMRLTEFFQTIPAFLFAILLLAIFPRSLTSIIVTIGIVTWAPIGRLVRGQFMRIRNREFVQACVCLGMTDLRIMFEQILPNCLSPIIVTGSLTVATAILTESALSFLGLGDPNVISWGFMVGSGRTFLRMAWWVSAIPGVAILVTVVAITFVGEGLDDTLNPRSRHR